MMISRKEKSPVVSLVLMSSLFLLTGCWGEKAKDVKEDKVGASHVAGQGDVLLSIDGKPMLYAQDFEDQKMMAQQADQRLNMLLQMMPDAAYSMLFKSMEASLLMKEWVIRSGIDQLPENVKQRRQYHDVIDLQLYMKYFQDAHPVDVTEEEAESFYKEKRDQIPGLLVSPAGVDIVYANFDSKAKAEDFVAKVRDGAEKHFKLAAKEVGVKLERMTIKADTTINEALKNCALAATKFPSKEVVKMDENSYWVVGMLKKKDAEYRSFDAPEVKDGITKMCKDEKLEMHLTKEIDKLRKEYNVEENTAYFETKKQNQAKALNAAQQLVLQAQQAAGQEDDVDGLMLLDDKI